MARRHLLIAGITCYVAAFILVGVLVAHSQSPYSLTLTGPGDAEVAALVTDINAQRTAENVVRAAKVPPDPPLPMLTRRLYLQSVLDTHEGQWLQQSRDKDKEAASGSWATRTAQQKTRICAALALSPCPP